MTSLLLFKERGKELRKDRSRGRKREKSLIKINNQLNKGRYLFSEAQKGTTNERENSKSHQFPELTVSLLRDISHISGFGRAPSPLLPQQRMNFVPLKASLTITFPTADALLESVYSHFSPLYHCSQVHFFLCLCIIP